MIFMIVHEIEKDGQSLSKKKFKMLLADLGKARGEQPRY